MLCTEEYEQICGKALKPEVLGYHSMDQMLRSMPDVLRVQEWNGKTLIKGVPKDSSQHVSYSFCHLLHCWCFEWLLCC